MAESTMRAVLVEHDTPQDTSDDTLIRLAGGYLATKPSPATRAAYRNDLKYFFRWCRANDIDPLVGIRRVHLELYARHMEDRGLAPSTRIRRIGTPRGWYEWLIDEDLFAGQNPVRKVAQPRNSVVSDLTVLSRREANILLAGAQEHSPRLGAFVALGFYNGLRVGEICSANVTDLGKMTYHRTLHIRGKGEKHDQVPLVPPCHEAVKAATAGRDTGPLIVTRFGTRMSRRPAGFMLDNLCRDLGITRITPHGLRRSAITILLQEGATLRDVQLFARHASSKTTERYDLRARSMDEHLGSVLIRAVA